MIVGRIRTGSGEKTSIYNISRVCYGIQGVHMEMMGVSFPPARVYVLVTGIVGNGKVQDAQAVAGIFLLFKQLRHDFVRVFQK